jgi:hypothetical protein
VNRGSGEGNGEIGGYRRKIRSNGEYEMNVVDAFLKDRREKWWGERGKRDTQQWKGCNVLVGPYVLLTHRFASAFGEHFRNGQLGPTKLIRDTLLYNKFIKSN